MISFAPRVKSPWWKGGEERSLRVTPCIKRVQWASFIEKNHPLLYCNYTGDPPLPSPPTRATSIHLSGFFKTMSRVSNGKQGTFFRSHFQSCRSLSRQLSNFEISRMPQRPGETVARTFIVITKDTGSILFNEKRETCS